jgi:hypothetical protein
MLLLLRSLFWLSIVIASISLTKWIRWHRLWRRPGPREECKTAAAAACLEEAAHLSRVVAGQRSGGNDKTPPNSPLVDASAAAH